MYNGSDKQLDIMSIAPLNPKLPIPLYHQLFSAIQTKIQSGDLPTGSKIPGEIQLAEHLNISRITVKRALNELAQSGLVARQRGRGTIVTANTDLNFNDTGRDYVKNVVKLRNITQATILGREVLEAPTDVKTSLSISQGALVEKITHTLSLENEVLSYVETYLPQDLTKDVTDADLLKEPLLTLLARHKIITKRAEQVILPVSADETVANALNAKIGRPLLKIHCVMYDLEDRPIQDISAWYHPDRYKYQMTLDNLNGA